MATDTLARALPPSEAPDRGDEDAPESPLTRVAKAAYPDLNLDMARAKDASVESRGRVREAMTERDLAVAPKVEGARTAMAEPQPARPASLALPAPPSRKLTDFLAPHEGQTPEASINKMVSALGMFAQMGGALARKHATAGLAAWGGAMKGWQEGDAARSEAAYADWKTNTSKAIAEHKDELDAYDALLNARGKTIEERLRDVKLTAWEKGNKVLAAEAEAESADKFLGLLTKERDHNDQVRHWHEQVEASREAARATADYRAEHLKMEREKVELQRQQTTDAVNALGPEAMTELGRQWFAGKLPPGIARGKAGTVLMPKIIAAGIEWAKGNGIDPAASMAVRAEMEATQKSLTKLRGTTVLSEAQAARFDTHLDNLVTMSESVDRSKRPVFNRWIMMKRGKYEGDAEVARFEVQALEVAMEYAKLTVGTAQGDAATREEARKVISTWLAHPQLRAVGDQLKLNAHNNIANNRATERSLVENINTLGGRTTGPSAPPVAPPQAMPSSAPAGPSAGGKRIAEQNGERFLIDATTDISKYPGARWAP